MPPPKRWALLLSATMFIASSFARAADDPYTVTWDSPGKNYKDSMPLGNGDLGLNLWTEQNGDVVFLIGKSDAWTENGQLVKLGRVRVSFSGSPFAPGAAFRQTLNTHDGMIELAGAGGAKLLAWVDINSPVIYLEFNGDSSTTMTAALETWRTVKRPTNSAKNNEEMSRGMRELNGNPDGGVTIEPDSVLPAKADRVTWVHHNARSVYPSLLENQHLQALQSQFADPLLNHTFGATIAGQGLVAADDRTLKSSQPRKQFDLRITALTRQAQSIEAWQAALDKLLQKTANDDPAVARKATQKWWNEFWRRSYIRVTGDASAAKMTQGYVMQRWMTAASGRGAQPLKYNGSIFTVGQEPPAGTPYDPDKGQHNADYRAWGSNYWFQNQRLIYWPMIADGDFDTLWPFFAMYQNALPLAKARTKIAYGIDAAIFPETMFYFGLPSNNDFGWGNKSLDIQNHWIRWHYNNALELTQMMLDTYAVTQDDGFLNGTLLPLAVPMMRFFDRHWKHVDGKLHFEPAAAIETRQQAVDPTPDIAGLMHVLPRLLALQANVTTAEDRALWKQMFAALPPLPRGKSDAKGKIPLTPKDAAPNGKDLIWPAASFSKPGNSENPELYPVFPYRLFGVGLPELQLARDTYDGRSSKSSTCWGQDGMDAAALGWADRAKAEVIANFTAYGGERFKWFWKPGHDWEPDMDNGGSGQLILQMMLMQFRPDNKILLLPAWPKEWDVEFKLLAPQNTTIEGVVRGGKLTELKVTPAEQQKNIIRMEPQ